MTTFSIPGIQHARWASVATIGERTIGLRVWHDGTHSIEEWGDNPNDREELHNGNNSYMENFSRWMHLVGLASEHLTEA